MLALWTWFDEQARHLSQAKLRGLCEKNFLSYVRMREWRSLHQELRGLFHEEGVHENTAAATEDVVHRALMTSLLGHLALREEEKRKTNPAKDKREMVSYQGVKGRKLAIHPGSALTKTPPKWLMSAQWLETTRVWGAVNAAINPRWIEPLAKHLLSREVSEPHYQADSGRVAAFETLSLYGLPVVLRRAVNYAAIDPADARRIFILEGVLGALDPDAVENAQAASPLSPTLSREGRGGKTPQAFMSEQTLDAGAEQPPPPQRGRVGERGGSLADKLPHLSPRDFARQLRSNQTEVEQRLWQHLRAHRFEGFKFRRQQPLGAYTVDFVCLDRRVVIELDGGQHAEAEGYDWTRDAWLKAQGFEVMRFWNHEVLQNLEGVLTVVYDTLAHPAAPSPQRLRPPRYALPARGEGAKTVVRRADELEQRGRHPWENAAFIQHNATLIAEIQALEAKARRPDILVDDAVLCAFFESRLPPEVVDGVTLAAALRKDKALDAHLRLAREDLMRHEAEAVTGGRLPDRLRLGELEVALRYHFEPGAADDGVTASVPLAELNRLDVQAAEWLVPGLLQEKVEALIRTLPKNQRRQLVPAPDVARALCERLLDGVRDWPPAGSLPERLSAEAQRMLGAQIEPADWPLETIEPHLRLRVELVDDAGEQRGSGRDLAEMQQALGGAAKRAFVKRFETRKGLIEWDFGELAEVMVVDVPVSVTSGLTPSPLAGEGRGEGATSRKRISTFNAASPSPQPSPVKGEGAKSTTTVYPALIDAGESVILQPMDTAEAAAQATAEGLTRLFVLAAREEVKALKREVARDNALCLLYSALPALKGVDKPCADLQDEVVWRVARAVFIGDSAAADWPRAPEAFAARVAACRPRLYAEGLEALRRLRAVLQAVQVLQTSLQQAAGAHGVAVKDMQAQLAGLFARDFIRATPPALWQRLPVYVQAMTRRLERLKQNPEREKQARAQLEPILLRTAKLKAVPDELNMMLEEWRVQLFAQELKTAMPVSLSRVSALLEAAGG